MRSTMDDDGYRRENNDFEEVVCDDEDDDLMQPATSLTPLMNASHGGHVHAVKYLLAHGAKVDLCDGDGMQALHFAAQVASAECFRVLLRFGADPLAKDNFGRSALQCVSLHENLYSPGQVEWLALLKSASNFNECLVEQREKADGKAVQGAWIEKPTTAAAQLGDTRCEAKEAKGAISL